MKYIDILSENSKNPGWRPGEPYWELDPKLKIYTVHRADGTEVSRYPYQHVWDSSPAMRKAKADYIRIYDEHSKDKKAREYETEQSKPLSALETKYYNLSLSVKKYAKHIWPKTPADAVDAETREIYLTTATKWLEEMNRLSETCSIRDSLKDGTYTPTAN